MNIASIKLTQHQTSLLLAINVAPDPRSAYNTAHKNARSAASLAVLRQMGMVVSGENGVEITPAGTNELFTSGYLDDSGNMTEYGQQYYQQAVKTLNEMHLAQSLLSKQFK